MIRYEYTLCGKVSKKLIMDGDLKNEIIIAIFFAGDVKIKDLDHIKKYNPGIGGSQYLVLLLYLYFQEYHSRIRCYLLTTDHALDGEDIVKVRNDQDAVLKAKQKGAREIIFIPNECSDLFYGILEESGLKGIAWVHNYISYQKIDLLEKCIAVKRVVFVGRQHYDSYIDARLINKSSYIYNMIPEVDHDMIPIKEKDNIVTYVGALIPAKGFHKVAKVWKKVLKEVPNAQLQVIGSGKLYRKQAKLGNWGLADKKYEKRFMKYLLDENGKILESVHFMGTLGCEKEKVIERSKVGIANPTGISETFCLSAVEFKTYAIPVVSYRGYGLLDTVRNNIDGILVRSNYGLKKALVMLLKDDQKSSRLGKNGLRSGCQDFRPQNIIPRWISLIHDVDDDKSTLIEMPSSFYFDDWKWLKMLNKKVKDHLGVEWPSISYIVSLIKYGLKKFLLKTES